MYYISSSALTQTTGINIYMYTGIIFNNKTIFYQNLRMTVPSDRIFIRYRNIDDIKREVSENKIKNCMIPEKGFSNDVKSWYLTCIMGIHPQEVDKHIYYYHQEEDKFSSECWCTNPDVNMSSHLVTYKKDFITKYQNANQLQLNFVTQTIITTDIQKAHDLEGQIYQILYRTAGHDIETLDKFESALMAEIETLQKIRKYLISRLMYKANNIDLISNIHTQRLTLLQDNHYRNLPWRRPDVINSSTPEVDKTFRDTIRPISSQKTDIPARNATFKLTTRFARKSPESEREKPNESDPKQ